MLCQGGNFITAVCMRLCTIEYLLIVHIDTLVMNSLIIFFFKTLDKVNAIRQKNLTCYGQNILWEGKAFGAC